MLPLPCFHAGQQRIHAVHDRLERLQQVGALRHQLRNVLRLQALQFGAGLHRMLRCRVPCVMLMNLSPSRLAALIAGHRIHRDLLEKLRPAPS